MRAKIQNHGKSKIMNVSSELQPGEDGITVEMFKYGGKMVVNTLHNLRKQVLK